MPADQSSGAEANIIEHSNEVGLSIKEYILQTLVLVTNELDSTKYAPAR